MTKWMNIILFRYSKESHSTWKWPETLFRWANQTTSFTSTFTPSEKTDCLSDCGSTTCHWSRPGRWRLRGSQGRHWAGLLRHRCAPSKSGCLIQQSGHMEKLRLRRSKCLCWKLLDQVWLPAQSYLSWELLGEVWLPVKLRVICVGSCYEVWLSDKLRVIYVGSCIEVCLRLKLRLIDIGSC